MRSGDEGCGEISDDETHQTLELLIDAVDLSTHREVQRIEGKLDDILRRLDAVEARFPNRFHVGSRNVREDSTTQARRRRYAIPSTMVSGDLGAPLTAILLMTALTQVIEVLL